MNFYAEPSKNIPVSAELDVLVVGGGPAGIGAAASAAKCGAKTMIIEYQNCLGGMASAGMMSHWSGLSHQKHPFLNEIYTRCFSEDSKWPLERNRDFSLNTINHEKLKGVLFDMMDDYGVELLLGVMLSDVIMENGKLKGVVIESKSGRQAIMAKVVIDCSGDGDAAFKSGAAFTKGREGDEVMQPVTMMFKIAGVDETRAVYPGSFETLIETANGELQALARKLLPHPAGHVLLYKSTMPGQVVVNMTNVTGIDGSSSADLTKAEKICRRQIPSIMKFLNEYVPGYENAYVLASASNVGVRETRHFKGLYTLNEDDIIEARVFEDWIALNNSFNFDIHNTKGAGLDANGAQKHFVSKGPYSIPYRACVPEKIDGLLLAGRCISGTHKAHSSYRVMGICLNIGYGVGVAAALAAKENIEVRNVNVTKVQNILLSYGIPEPEIK